ncbi:MAG: hypothetical protein ACOCQN_01620 [Halanaerobiaceae bacterium]
MDRECKDIQLILQDIYYNETEMESGIKEHLKRCSECRAYWQDLQQIGETLNSLDIDQPVDYEKIENAISRQEKRKFKTELLGFSLLAVLYAFILFFMFQRINIRYFVYFQGAVYLSLPLFVIPIFYHRRTKDDFYGR